MLATMATDLSHQLFPASVVLRAKLWARHGMSFVPFGTNRVGAGTGRNYCARCLKAGCDEEKCDARTSSYSADRCHNSGV